MYSSWLKTELTMGKDGVWIKLQGLYFDVTFSRTLIFLPQFYITFHSLSIHRSLHYEMILYSLPGR
jgi:hypothetical protein